MIHNVYQLARNTKVSEVQYLWVQTDLELETIPKATGIQKEIWQH